MFPEISLFGIQIPSYFLVISLTYSILIYLSVLKAEKERKNIRTLFSLMLILIVSSGIGARAFHVIWESPGQYTSDPIKILQFWHGGFVFYGGLLFSAFTMCTYLAYNRLDFFEWTDFFAPIVAFGYGIGRLACLLEGCCYGTMCDLPWAINGRHPTQLYSIFLELILALLLFALSRKSDRQGRFDFGKHIFDSGSLTGIWMTGHGLNRFIVEQWRDDFRGPLISGWSISRWIAVIILFSGCILIGFRVSKAK